MTVEKLTEAVKAEVAMSEAEYYAALDAMLARVQEAKTRPVSTHTGFNLGSNASDLQAIATKVESAKRVLMALDGGVR